MRFCWAQYSFWAMIALLGSIALFSGCGAKGDLFMPEEDSSADTGASAASVDDVPSVR